MIDENKFQSFFLSSKLNYRQKFIGSGNLNGDFGNWELRLLTNSIFKYFEKKNNKLIITIDNKSYVLFA